MIWFVTGLVLVFLFVIGSWFLSSTESSDASGRVGSPDHSDPNNNPPNVR